MVAACVLFGLSTQPAVANVEVTPKPGGNGVDTRLDWKTRVPGSKRPVHRGSVPVGQKPKRVVRCTYEARGDRELPIWFEESMRTSAVLMWRECPEGATQQSGWVLITPSEDKPVHAPSEVIPPRVLAGQAHNSLPLPPPDVATNPNFDPNALGEALKTPYTLVKLPTWWWVTNAKPVTQRTQAGPIWVDVTATPVRTVWRPFARGKRLDAKFCDSMGVPFEERYRPPGWRPSKPNGDPPPKEACIVVPQRADRDATANVDLVWEVSWVANTGETGTLPTIATTTKLTTPTFERHALITS